MFWIPAKQTNSAIPDLTVSTNAGLEVEAWVPEVGVKSIVDTDVEGNIFTGSEKHLLVADI